jgi:hypothetical protein
MVTHLAPTHVVATALHTVTGQHMAATAQPRAANVLHTATAMAQPAVAQLAALLLVR